MGEEDKLLAGLMAQLDKEKVYGISGAVQGG